MEIVWAETLKKNDWVLDIFDIYFSTMKNQNIGKASTNFFETAAELKNIVLANKIYQSTRFVRSLLRGLQAALRNLPTLFNVLAKEFNEAALDTDNTTGKILLKIMDKLQNVNNLLFLIGFVQILEIFTEVSIEVQYSNHFPTQAWSSIDAAKDKLANLGENWIWSEEEQKFSKIGVPKKILDNIMQCPNNIYTPFVPVGAIKKNMNKVNFDNIEDIDIFDEDKQQEFEPAGSLPMKNMSNDNLNRVQMKLSNFVKDLLLIWDQRQKKTALQEMTLKVFGKIHDNSDPIEYHQITLNLLKSLIEEIPQNQRAIFDANEVHEGFMNWNQYWKKFVSISDNKLPIQIVHFAYESWVKETKEKFVKFQEIFENCMIRGTSEAACESVGSIMKIHASRNRHLDPTNFSKEIVLKFNLGPILELEDFIEEIYCTEKKDYIRKTSRIDQFVTKDLKKSAAVANFERKEKEKCHFPLSFWKKQ